jgi:hypothetical protein
MNIRRLQAAGGSASGRASLLDRVGGKVSGDGPELVNLEQDLRVLAKLRKDILSGKHPIYKPPPPGAAAAGLPERPRQPIRETALSLSDRITPNPAVDTQKEEQDFFNSIAQSLPADLSKSAVKRSNDEAATHGEGDLAKRLRTDARDYPAHQNGAGAGPSPRKSSASTSSPRKSPAAVRKPRKTNATRSPSKKSAKKVDEDDEEIKEEAQSEEKKEIKAETEDDDTN